MAKSDARTVAEYLAELPGERREVVSIVRDLILRHLPEGYKEAMSFGMICYFVPLERFPDTYNGQPLGYVSLAAQKNHYALYLMCVYQSAEREKQLREAFKAAGKRLDMGKSCVRFRKLDDLPLETIGELIAATPVDAYVSAYEAIKRARR
jgi:Domain of unknown function (DU1801)